MTKHLEPEQGLPDGLATRIQLLAEKKTDGSQSFPGVDRAIRRERRVRFAGIAAAMAVVAAVATGSVLVGEAVRGHNTPDNSAPANTPDDPQQHYPDNPQTPEDAGYPAKASGSLSEDAAWLEEMRERAFTTSSEYIVSKADVYVVAAGDVEGELRYALTVTKMKEAWEQKFWIGEQGAAVKDMASDTRAGARDSVPVGPFMTIRDDVVLVSAPQERSASVLSARRVEADGRYVEERRELPEVAQGVWADAVTTDELRYADTRAGDNREMNGEAGTSFEPDFGSVVVPKDTTAMDQSNVNLLFASGPDVLAGLEDQPVYGAVVPTDANRRALAGLLRSPSGAFLYAIAEINQSGQAVSFSHAAGTYPAGLEQGEVMAALRTAEGDRYRYVVLAPDNAVQVRVGDQSAEVKHRIGILELPKNDDQDGVPLPVQALDQDGRVIVDVVPEHVEVQK
ncbi:hypothetical protein [Kineosporia babensis]|uniref:Uncharacterized protein n=1 Tax=Kineosporia babensis TaxID=499548 RepID=A0A9X1NF09_9ACTN|nr:hypothetical protein [Kineosporia babensis]MCD5311883.1 hypothetical protein [Kineosporia babensis]